MHRSAPMCRIDTRVPQRIATGGAEPPHVRQSDGRSRRRRVPRRARIVGHGVGRRCGSPFDRVPRLDGTLLLDEATRRAYAQDFGQIVSEEPVAVLRPGLGARHLPDAPLRRPPRHPRRRSRRRPHGVRPVPAPRRDRLRPDDARRDRADRRRVHHRRRGLQVERRAAGDAGRRPDAARAARLHRPDRRRDAVGRWDRRDVVPRGCADRPRRRPARGHRRGPDRATAPSAATGAVRDAARRPGPGRCDRRGHAAARAGTVRPCACTTSSTPTLPPCSPTSRR